MKNNSILFIDHEPCIHERIKNYGMGLNDKIKYYIISMVIIKFFL